MAFVVALAWKDAVHSMFESWFPVPKWRNHQGGRTACGLVSNGPPLCSSTPPHHRGSHLDPGARCPRPTDIPKKAEEEGDRGASGETQKSRSNKQRARMQALRQLKTQILEYEHSITCAIDGRRRFNARLRHLAPAAGSECH